MSDKISAFFEAWGEADAGARSAAIRAAVAPDIYYADPRSPEPITDVEALLGYVGMFSEMAPGATVQVVRSDEVQGAFRVAIAFGMADGNSQHGQYFVEVDGDGLVTKMVGFVGFGVPE
ncbi:MAG: molecular chaperone GroEL [Pseudomonadota bacterium]